MTPRDRAQFHWRIAFFVWLVLLTISTHWPQGEIAEQPVFESPDKLLHMICFGILAFCFMCCGWIQSKWFAWFLVSCWAAIDEASQGIMHIGREPSVQDLIASEVGITCSIAWMGALHTSATAKILETTELVLARPQHWITLGALALVAASVPCMLLWLMFLLAFNEQFNTLVLLIGFLFSIVSVLYCFVKIGNMESESMRLRKNMATPMYGTMVIAVMVGFSVSHTFFDPWVALLASLAVGTRFSWNRAINLQLENQGQ